MEVIFNGDETMVDGRRLERPQTGRHGMIIHGEEVLQPRPHEHGLLFPPRTKYS